MRTQMPLRPLTFHDMVAGRDTCNQGFSRALGKTSDGIVWSSQKISVIEAVLTNTPAAYIYQGMVDRIL